MCICAAHTAATGSTPMPGFWPRCQLICFFLVKLTPRGSPETTLGPLCMSFSSCWAILFLALATGRKASWCLIFWLSHTDVNLNRGEKNSQ